MENKWKECIKSQKLDYKLVEQELSKLTEKEDEIINLIELLNFVKQNDMGFIHQSTVTILEEIKHEH